MARILVIDDDAQIRSLLVHLLSQAGYQVASAEDGEAGIALYRAQPADLVVTDIVMPRKGGLEAVTELQRDYPGLQAIVMSGAHDVADLLSTTPGMRTVRTIKKPFLPTDLLAAVKQALANPHH